jgi:hypothetical protein
MPQRAALPPLGHGRGGTVYLVLDDFGALGSAFRRRTRLKPTLTTVVADLLSGQYRHPLRVAFNTAEGWARDVSAAIARQVLASARELDASCGARFRGTGVCVRASMTSRRPPKPSLKPDVSLVRHGISVA